MIIGLFVGLINWSVNAEYYLIEFNPQIFLYGFLPIIIYEAGFSMNKVRARAHVAVVAHASFGL